MFCDSFMPSKNCPISLKNLLIFDFDEKSRVRDTEIGQFRKFEHAPRHVDRRPAEHYM